MRPDEVRQLLEFYGAAAKQHRYPLGVSEQSVQRSRPKKYHRDAVPGRFQRFPALESEATTIELYEVEAVIGLL